MAGKGRRIGAAGLSVALAGALAMAMSHAEGFSAARLSLSSGQAWVASSRVGQIALIDGGTEQRVAAVTVARPGDQISVTQSGPDALVVDRTDGSVLRVRGATYADSPGAVRPLPGAGAGLSVFAGAGSLAYAVDAERGAAIGLDRDTMRVRSRMVSLAARLSADATVIDAEGRLWAVDTDSGDLVWFDRSGKHLRRGAATGPGSRLTLVRGRPAVVDLGRRQVSLLNPDNGRTAATACLDVARNSAVEVGGSSSAALVFSVVPARGALLISDLDSGQCSRIVTLTSPGVRLGTPVETGGRVFVPDYASGSVFVVDLGTDRLVATSQVLPAGLESFDLTPRDGFVFYNDPASQRSGVIRLDGTMSRISKYDPNDPTGRPHRPTLDTPQGQPVDGRGAGPLQGATPSPGSTVEPSPSSTDRSSARSPSRTAPPVTPPPSISTDPGPPSSRASLRIRSEPGPYLAGHPVTFEVGVVGSAASLASVSWTFGDGGAGSTTRVSHAWADPGRYTLGVSARLSDGSTVRTSAQVTVVAAQAEPDQPPVAVLRLTPARGSAPLPVTAEASGSSDPDGRIVSYAVDWGDGSPQSVRSDPTFSHTYPNSCGKCKVTLTVTDDKGLSATDVATVDVGTHDTPPSVVMTFNPQNRSVTAGDNVLVVLDGVDDRIATTTKIDWGDGSRTSFESHPAPYAHVYRSAGVYKVTGTAKDSAGQTGSSDADVTVHPQTPPFGPPAAVLSVSPKSGTVGLTVTADASGSTTGGPKSDLTYLFDWGDGDSSGKVSTPTLTHRYAARCSCEIFLYVYDAYQQRDVDTALITVTEPDNQPPKARLQVPATTQVGAEFTVDASGSTDDQATAALSYSYDWGDGEHTNGVSAATATHKYADTCTCVVTVKVTDQDGAADTASGSVRVQPAS